MSFPKAKIHRFNEEMTCAPPPGKYDPKFDTKVKGVVIEKSKRFVEPKLSSASSAESIDSIGGKSTSSVSVLPVFRTPQLKRSYLKTPRSVPANHHTGTATASTGSAINVRRNLDTESLSNDSNQLKTENYVLSTQLQQKNDEIKKLNDELNKLHNDVLEEQEKIKEERKIAETNHEEEIKHLSEQIDRLKTEIDEEKVNHTTEIEEIVSEAEAKIESMKLADNEKIKKVEAEFDILKMEIEVDFKVKLNELKDEMEKEIESISKKVETTVAQAKETESDLMKKSDEYNAVFEETQSKLEQALKDLATVSAKNSDLKGINLEKQMTLDKSNNRVTELENDLSKITVELMRSKQTCKNFHVASMEHRKTIEALSKRLYESESEVERLNSVQSDLENQKRLLEGKAESLVMEIINLRESMKYLESEIIRDVNEIKTQLMAKVDSYRIKAAEETKTLLETVEEKQRTIDMLVSEIDYYRNRLQETEGYISSIKAQSEQYCLEIEQLKRKLTEAEDDFAERINVQKNLYLILDENHKENCELVKKLQMLQVKSEQHIGELVEKLDHQSECAQRATSQINCLTSDNNAKEEQIESLVSKLEASVDCVNTISKHVENLMSQLDDKNNQINTLQDELETKLSSYISVVNENDDLKIKVEQKMQHIETLEKEIRDNEKYVDELISDIVLEKERGSELASLLSQTEDEKFKLEDELKSVQTENESLSCTCSGLQDELRKMQDTISFERKECLRLSQILNEHEKNKQDLEEKLEQENIEKAQLILELSTKIDNLEELLKNSDDKKTEVENENHQLMTQLDAAQEQINDLQSVNASTKLKAEELNGRVEEMSTELINRSKEMEKLQSEVDMSKFEDAVASLKEEIIVLCDNIDSKERMVAELSEIKINLEDELIKSAHEYKEKIEELEEQINDEIKKNNELSESYSKMENRKNEYKLYSCKITEEVDLLKEQLAKLQDEKNRLENEKKQLEVMVGPFMKQLRDYEEERNMLATKKGAVEEELYALERKYAQSLGHQNLKQKIHYVSRLKEENIQFKQTIDQLASENIRLKNKCKDLEVASRENRENNSPRAGKKSINRPGERVHSPNVLKDRNLQ